MDNKKQGRPAATQLQCPSYGKPNSSREMAASVREELKRDEEMFKHYSLTNGGTRKI